MLLNALLITFNALLYTGIGWAALGIVNRGQTRGWFAAFWAGWAAAIGLLQVWHFFFPVSTPALVLMIVVSAAGWAIFARAGRCRDLLKGDKLALLAASALPLLIMANHVLFSEPSYDHGLYHLQTVKWYNAHAIVRGLGNLHHRLAFNSANLLPGALFNSGPLAGYGVYTANSTVMVVLAARGLQGLAAWVKAPAPQKTTHLYHALLLPAGLWQASQYPLAGYSADMVIFALGAALGGMLLGLSERAEDERFCRGQGTLMVMLIAAGVAVKLSFAAFGAALLASMLATGWKHGWARKSIHLWAGLGCAWVLPWAARNIIMSGYPLYPSALLGLPVAWRMPAHLISDISAGITEWARTYSGQIAYTGDLAWLGTWLLRFVYEPRQAFLISMALLAFIALAVRLKWAEKPLAGGVGLLMAASALSLVFWFLSAPTYRFSGAAFWTLYAGAIIGAYRAARAKWGERGAAAFSILFIIFLFYSLRNDFSKNISPGRLLAPAREDITAEQQQPLAGLEARTTLSGLEVYVPPESSPETCWNAPLPCTTRNDYLERLSLLEPGDLGGGFLVSE